MGICVNDIKRRVVLSVFDCFKQICREAIYVLKINNRNTKARYEICSKLTVRTPVRHQWGHSGVFIVNFEHILGLVLVFLLLTWNM